MAHTNSCEVAKSYSCKCPCGGALHGAVLTKGISTAVPALRAEASTWATQRKWTTVSVTSRHSTVDSNVAGRQPAVRGVVSELVIALLEQKRAKGGRTLGEVRRRARDAWALLLAGDPPPGTRRWTRSDSMDRYIETVSIPLIDDGALSKNSRDRYHIVVRYLRGQCSQHDHTDSLAEHTIESGTTFRALEKCLQEIARLHGAVNARHARSVLGKYVLDQLMRDGLLSASPIAGARLDLRGPNKSRSKARGGVALNVTEWNRVLEYLFALDPAEGVVPPKRGRWTIEDRIAVRAAARDLTVLQALTGLRVSEATHATCAMAHFTQDHLILDLPESIVKTRRGRLVHIGDEEAIDLLHHRWTLADDPSWPLIGSSAKPGAVWDQRQRNKAVAELYVEMAEALEIPALLTERSHVWRTTINTLTMKAGVPEALRTAHLGHTIAVSRKHYTDVSDGQLLTSVLGTLRGEDET